MGNLQNFQILIIFCAVLLLCNQNFSWAWRSFKIIFISFPHQFNANLLDVKIQIQNDTAEPALNVVITALEDIDDISLSYSVAVESEKADNFTTVLTRKVHLCKFLQQRTIDNVLRSVYDDVLKGGNFIKACPLKKAAVYTLQEYHVDEEHLPQYVPEAKFYLDLLLEKGTGAGAGAGSMLLKGRLNGKIDKSKGFNNLQLFSMG